MKNGTILATSVAAVASDALLIHLKLNNAPKTTPTTIPSALASTAQKATAETKYKDYIACQSVKELNGHTLTKSIKRPLHEQDLIIIGRRDPLGNNEEDYENALGKLGFQILKNRAKNASVLSIQSNSF